MPEFFLELFSEEIPAGLQKEAAFNLAKLVAEALAPLAPPFPCEFFGPRRIAIRADVTASIPASKTVERGPRSNAPEQALAGFLRKHDTTKDRLTVEGDFWVLHKEQPESTARQLILDAIPKAIKRLPWPKSMRWNQGHEFSWIRPLRRIVCLLDGNVVPIQVSGLTAGNETEGHRNHGGVFTVSSAIDWETKLLARCVRADQAKRSLYIGEALPRQLAKYDLSWVEDFDLLEEVNGLVEWPVPLVGKIDEEFMDLPPEVRELSMKTNQKYFALRDAAGSPAPYFGFVANLEAPDGGAAIIAGNERVLRARLSDARHFWNLDLQFPLDYYLQKLSAVTFHEKLGTQAKRVERISALSKQIASSLGALDDDAEQAGWAGLLCKADLVTGMVGEFPDLQGIMGGYYARISPRGWNGEAVGTAISTHYLPKGPEGQLPAGTVARAVALADRLDTLVSFFKIGEKPTGSGDPYALRRAALGVIRIILETQLSLPLKPLLNADAALFDFIIARLRVKLRAEGKRFDIVDAVLSAGADDDLLKIMKKAEALDEMLGSADGKNLFTAYKRAANILKIESAKSGPHGFDPDQSLFNKPEEHALFQELTILQAETSQLISEQNYTTAMSAFARLRGSIDAFFNAVTVNDSDAQIRGNRLALLSRFRHTVDQIADFSKLEG